ncbi:MAG TPA: CPBP family intramembrane glutamic endopeptidase [Gemmatimonadales bacterium]|jgi:hypothetical protein
MMSGYWRASRAPRYSLTFAFPLLLAYELLALLLSHDSLAGVRNGADVLLKSLFVAFGGRDGLVVFGIVIVGTALALVWRDRRRNGRIEFRFFPLMAAESMLYAMVFGLVAGTLTGLLLRGLAASASHLALQDAPILALPSRLMISLGAGIYEELLFRVLVVGSLAWLGRRALGWSAAAAGIAATVIGALIFSAFHYVGPYGDRLVLASFTFRTIAGVLFSALYLLRGFGITAWTHALYDVILTLTGSS